MHFHFTSVCWANLPCVPSKRMSVRVSLALLLLLFFGLDTRSFQFSRLPFSASSCSFSGMLCKVNLNPPTASAFNAPAYDTMSSSRPPSDSATMDEVFRIIYQLLENQQVSGVKDGEDSYDDMTVDTKILLDNAHILVQNYVYEQAMEELLDGCDSKEAVSVLERLDGVVRSFIQSERKSRCRLKVNYLINGAASNRLEEAILMLSNANEIDDNLLRFIDSLIQKRITFVGGPTADKEDEKLLSASGKDAVKALKMVYKRLKAEMQFKKDFNLKLLAELIDEKDSDKHETMLRKALPTVEKFEIFSGYVEEGIDNLSHMIQLQSTSPDDDGNTESTNSIVKTLQRMRDIKWCISDLSKNLKTGLLDENDLFSTDTDDYVESPKQSIDPE